MRRGEADRGQAHRGAFGPSGGRPNGAHHSISCQGLTAASDGFGPGPSLKARRPEAIFFSPARPEPDFFQPDPSLTAARKFRGFFSRFPPSVLPGRRLPGRRGVQAVRAGAG